IDPDASGDLQRDDPGDRVRQPLAVQRSGYLEHGETDGAVADLHDDSRSVVPAGTDGPPTGSRSAARAGFRAHAAVRIRRDPPHRRAAGGRIGRSMSATPRADPMRPRAGLALDNLQAFVILLVLSFHSVLAYLDFL